MIFFDKAKGKVVALVFALLLILTVGITSVGAAPSTTDEAMPVTTTVCVTESTTITPDEAHSDSGGNNYGFWIGIGAVVVGGLIATAVIGIKAKKDEDEDE